MNIIDQYVEKDGKVKLTQLQFSKIISDYYKKQYNLNVVFDFLTINYVYIDGDAVGSETRKIKVDAFFPCLIQDNSHMYFKSRNIVIPGTIRLENLNAEIKKALPEEIIRISNDDIKNIFNELGFSMPLYDCFYNNQTNELEYSVKMKKLDSNNKIKVLEY